MKRKTTTKTKTPERRPPAQQQRPPAPAPRTGTDLAPRQSNLPALNYGEFGPRAGMEDADAQSFALPFLLVLQKMSPQLDRNHAAYIEGAKEGDFLNTANMAVYDGNEGILVMPVNFKRSFVAWLIREKGGGFKGEYTPADPLVITTQPDSKNRAILPGTDIQLVDTRLHGVILLDDTPTPALLSLTSTQIKKSKRWMSAMQELQTADGKPTFAHAYKITTVPESNDKGNWMGLQIDRSEDVTDQEQVDTAIAFYRALRAGSVKMAANAAAGAAGEAG